MIAHLLLWFTKYFLSSLHVTLTDQFDFLYQFVRLREILAIIIGSIILYATALRTLHRFRSFEWREFAIPPKLPELFAQAVHELFYYVGNFFRIIGIAFVTVLREAIVYTWKTFFNPHLWRTILYIVATAGVSALLVAESAFVQPYLAEVLRNSQPFFTPSAYVIFSYLVVIVAFALAAGSVVALIHIRLSRASTRLPRNPIYKRFTFTSSILVICMWITAFTAWILNLIFQFDAEQFVTLGYFTCVAIIFAIRAAISAFRSGELTAQPSERVA